MSNSAKQIVESLVEEHKDLGFLEEILTLLQATLRRLAILRRLEERN